MIKRKFGMKTLDISQGRFGGYSHQKNNAYDLVGSDSGIDFFYAENELIVIGVYPYEKTGFSNTVHFYDRENDVTLAMTHMNNIDKFYYGKLFKAGDVIYMEGIKGRATGNHIHLEMGKGRQLKKSLIDYVWKLKDQLNIEDYFYLDEGHTIKRLQGYKFEIRYNNAIKTENEGVKMDKFVEGYQLVSWLGKRIHVFKQPKNSKVGLISGDDYNQRKLLSDFKLEGKKILCLINASYFIDNPKSSRNGEICGREQSFTRDDRPEQKEWLDLVITNDLEIICKDLANWEYPKDEVILGLSPAVAILQNGQDITNVSSAAGYSKYTKAYPQTLLMQNYDNDIVVAVTRDLLTGEQCRNFAKANGMKNCFMLDSGDSSQMVIDGEWKAKTGRTLPNALCFYSDIDTKEESDANIKPIGKITVHRIGLHIRNHLLFAKRKPIGNRVGFIAKGETVEIVDFVSGLQPDGFQWVKVQWGNGVAYAQYDSTCYSVEIYK